MGIFTLNDALHVHPMGAREREVEILEMPILGLPAMAMRLALAR
jgi:hypothetical protein